MRPETADRQNLRRQPPDMSRTSTDCAKCARTREWLVELRGFELKAISECVGRRNSPIDWKP
jgi:hypothetical protein